jgi:hypothetical protein
MKTELMNLSAQGVTYIQIDALRYSYSIDPKWREWIRSELAQDPDTASKKRGLEKSRCCVRSTALNNCHLELDFDLVFRQISIIDRQLQSSRNRCSGKPIASAIAW